MLKDLDLNRYDVYIATGYTDLRFGVAKLVNRIQFHFNTKDMYSGRSLFLFCGRSARTIKAIVWDEDGWVCLSKKLVNGHYQWPRSQEEVRLLTADRFRDLMNGFNIESTIPSQNPT